MASADAVTAVALFSSLAPRCGLGRDRLQEEFAMLPLKNKSSILELD